MRHKLQLLGKALMGLNCMALTLVIQTANSGCVWIFHQPEFPEEAKRYQRTR